MEFRDPELEKVQQKIRHFCAYQERSQQQVRDKLFSLGIKSSAVEKMIADLIEEDYLNEERYAVLFAGGKFRINHWGRIKIRHALQQQKISALCIKNALNSIDDIVYRKTLQRLADVKAKSLANQGHVLIRKQKIIAYLLQKGFESALIQECLKD